ncbi:MAG: radical SAM protein [Chlorobiaceae bacterium]
MHSDERQDRPLYVVVSGGEPNIVYDAGTNRLLNLDSRTAEALPGWNGDAELLPSSEKFNTLISAEKKHGWLSRHRPGCFALPWSEQTIRHKLSSSLDCLVLAVTTACNFRCSYCLYGNNYEGYRPHGNRMMAYETTEAALSFFERHSRDSGELHLNFYGGEPLLNFPLIEKSVERFPKIAAGRKYYYHLTTNGFLLHERRIAELLVEHDVCLTVSLDGPERYHDSRRRTLQGEATFGTIMQGLELIDQLDHDYFMRNVMINCVIDAIRDLPATRNFFLEHTLLKNLHIICSTVKNDGFSRSDLQENRAAQAELEEELFARFRSEQPVFDSFLKRIFVRDLVKIHRRQGFEGFESHEALTGLCIPGLKELFVDIDGRFHLCENTCDELTVGNLSDGYDLEAIKGIVNAYREIGDEFCTRCWAVRFCSLCFVHAFTGATPDKEKLSRYCERERNKILGALRLYVRLRKEVPESPAILEADSIV